jgi:hypothetical protein
MRLSKPQRSLTLSVCRNFPSPAVHTNTQTVTLLHLHQVLPELVSESAFPFSE